MTPVPLENAHEPSRKKSPKPRPRNGPPKPPMKPMPKPAPWPNIQRPPGPPGPRPSKSGWNGPSVADAAKLLFRSEKPDGTVVNADDASSNAELAFGALDSLHAAIRAA